MLSTMWLFLSLCHCWIDGCPKFILFFASSFLLLVSLFAAWTPSLHFWMTIHQTRTIEIQTFLSINRIQSFAWIFMFQQIYFFLKAYQLHFVSIPHLTTDFNWHHNNQCSHHKYFALNLLTYLSQVKYFYEVLLWISIGIFYLIIILVVLEIAINFLKIYPQASLLYFRNISMGLILTEHIQPCHILNNC